MKKLVFVFGILGSFPGFSQVLATIELKWKGPQQLLTPVAVNLDQITLLPDSTLQLVEIAGNAVEVPYQIDYSGQRNMLWLVKPDNRKSVRTFQIRRGKPKPSFTVVAMEDQSGNLTMRHRNNNLLRYHHQTVYPPSGVDTVYRRSGFIHPLWSPRGQELTRINAPDHYHHWGMWNPWTHVLFENDTVDFWNLARRQGTVRFANFLSKVAGPVFSEFETLHEHVAFRQNMEKVALREIQGIRIYTPADNYYIADVDIQLNSVGESPVTLLEYRYGGLGIRATADWNRDNSTVLTSEGKSRPESDGSKARWCMVQGKVGNDHAGFVMMSYPTNYNYPEPLRVWPENSNGRGDVFVNFSPTKDMNWVLHPGKNYVLRYRFVVFNDEMTAGKAEAAWQDFANPPQVTIKKSATK